LSISTRRACHAKRVEIAGNRYAAGSHLRAVEERMRIAIERRNGRSPVSLDLRPIGIEFLSEHQGQRSHDTLAHFRGRAQKRDGVIGADGDPGVERGGIGGECLRAATH
jgi:hypothetical protein